MKNEKGFTMTELLAVIVILGVVMVIVVPGVTRYISESSNTYYKSLEKDVALAARDYMNDHRSQLPKENASFCYITKNNDDLDNGYIKAITDKNGNVCSDYVIKVTRNNPNDYSYDGYIDCGEYKSNSYPEVNSNLCVVSE